MPHLAHAIVALCCSLLWMAMGFVLACSNFDLNIASRRLLAVTNPWVEVRAIARPRS